MLSADSVLSPGLVRILPDEMKNRHYGKVAVGDVKTIRDVAYMVYQARDEDGNLMFRKDNSPVLNVKAYVGFDDMSIASFKGEKAIGQLVSETGAYPQEIGMYYYKMVDEIDVKIIEVKQKYGKNEYPVMAFEPIE